MSQNNSQPLFYQCVVLDNQDPLMLGRVRARRLTDDYTAVVRSFNNPPFNEEKDKWTDKDPFIFNPLLPYFIYQVPEVGEMINILYYNADFEYRNQFYIQAMYSTPTISAFEYYIGTQKFTGEGVQYTDPLPIKNQDGTYQSNIPKGVFPEPGDNALLGRGNSDVIVKSDGVLIRSNKIKGNFIPNKPPVANNKGAFLQLEKFAVNKTKNKRENRTELLEDVQMCNYLIEYQIINPDNTQNSYSGYVYLYKLKRDKRVNTSEIKVNSEIEDLKSLIVVSNFVALTLEDTIKFINDFINEINSRDKYNGRRIFNSGFKFPIYYRPNPLFYKIISTKPQTPNTAYDTSNKVFSSVRLNSSAKVYGYGLIYTQGKVGKPFKLKKVEFDTFKYLNNPTTLGALAADKVLLLSQTSAIPGKGVINFDGTLYGITNEKYVEEFLPKTSSLVRGEELIELLNLIVRFLVTHTHAFPGLPPVPVGYDGVRIEQILAEIQNASNKILNENIRLN
jgi:hypothetical protein